MPEATDQQMQQYANERFRVRAEQARALVSSLRDDKAAIDDIYARAAGSNPWADDRQDGPPRLLTQQDMLVFNAVLSLILEIIDGVGGVEDGTPGEQKIFQLNANWNTFISACVRPIGS